jgi:hypothetical protein
MLQHRSGSHFQPARFCAEGAMLEEFESISVVRFHDEKLSAPDWPDDTSQATVPGVWRWIAVNHRCNCLLWNEEDKARRNDVGPAEIAASKRLIDRYNQLRNDAVELIDEALLALLPGNSDQVDARLICETAGAMIDRLSILALKIHHMRKQTRRSDADAAHIETCNARLRRLIFQRSDLATCLEQLLADARSGRAYFKVYRQFKMYNDPALNPYLYARAPS